MDVIHMRASTRLLQASASCLARPARDALQNFTCCRLRRLHRPGLLLAQRGIPLHLHRMLQIRVMSQMASVETTDTVPPVEEETTRGYKPKYYYPVELGEIFNDRYKTVGKLGFGSASTVWLCRDITEEDRFVALKVYINNSKYHREIPVYDKINTLRTEHKGQYYVRKMYDSFELQGPHGTHVCLVHQPLGPSLNELREVAGGLFDAELIRETLRPILSGLQFLHKEVQAVHTDLQPSNMLLGVDDESIDVFAKFEQDEMESPSLRKELKDRTIYLSRPMRLTNAAPKIADLSEARFADADASHTDPIMPNVYRAPEVILDMPWSYPADVWGFAMVLWDLFEPNHPFPTTDSEGRYSESHHLASMVAIMGPPPLEFLQRGGEKVEQYWDEDGNWKGMAPIPNITLDIREQRLEGEEKQQFLTFMKKMLQWRPEDRETSEDVYWDEWLLADLIGNGEVGWVDEA